MKIFFMFSVSMLLLTLSIALLLVCYTLFDEVRDTWQRNKRAKDNRVVKQIPISDDGHINPIKACNEIKIRDERVMAMEVGNGWTITDVWVDPDIPTEKIDCIKVKFERHEERSF